MRNILTVMKLELLQISRMRSVLLILFVLPLLLIFVLGSALSSQFSASEYKPEQVKLAVYNQDAGMMKTILQQFFQSTKTQEILEITNVDSEVALKNLIKTNEADGGLIIPAAFSQEIMGGRTADWTYVAGPSASKNDMARMMLQTFTDQATQTQAAAIVLGKNSIADGQHQVGIPTNHASKVAESASAVKIGKLQDNLYEASSFQYYSCTMLIMFLLFGGMSAAISLLQEVENKTFQRMIAAPVPVSHVLLGKLLGSTIQSIIQGAIIIGFTGLVYGVDWGTHLLGVGLTAFFTIIASICLATILAGILKSSKAVESIYSTIVFVMTFLSGGMIVFVGGELEGAGKFTLNYWANGSVFRFMMGVDVGTAWNLLIVLMGIAAVLLVLAVGFSRRVGSIYE
ncbi:ABC transporter permease [Paenibacillus guangzhouensis]|uniref:ABC transporter permease n=1 Tax=Paenibacillus guangzhouensis TaxID=1473112 RepID=UPI001266DC1E|nr:ABC transporter permease [Paenibacillus guangzhouensis]